jgi:glycogen phosphorylase
VQFLFAGKAHPHDEPGKLVLQQIAEMMRDLKFGDKLVFIGNYDINAGRYLVQGVDVWLNNPRRSLEASGASGQKVVPNGGLNFSVLDGWWAESRANPGTSAGLPGLRPGLFSTVPDGTGFIFLK